MAVSHSQPVIPPIVQIVLGSQAGRTDSTPPVTHLQGSDEWGRAIDDLLAIRQLEDNWDGLGAKAPPANLVDSAIRLAQVLRSRGLEAPARVVAGPDGTVILEWQPPGWYIDIEVSSPHQGEATFKQGDQPAVFQTIDY